MIELSTRSTTLESPLPLHHTTEVRQGIRPAGEAEMIAEGSRMATFDTNVRDLRGGDTLGPFVSLSPVAGAFKIYFSVISWKLQPLVLSNLLMYLLRGFSSMVDKYFSTYVIFCQLFLKRRMDAIVGVLRIVRQHE